ncbi:E3 ubiquitin-protein ligase RNFT1 [Gadus morhua]|uniref:E3 ubiquitin-protein ligase RNFT1 n=1 Tax=Gadus morhua TaxID=8049 RepID=A0A8C4ZIW6_GADMO|nr:E3 ubiquitin-protein ligase RNFT1 [Gadus morhua]
MKLRVQYDGCESRRASKLKESQTVMQPNSDERDAHAGNGLSLNLQQEHLTKTQTPTGAPALAESGEVRVHMTGDSGETSAGGASSRRSRASSHSHSHSHGHSRAQHPPHTHEPESAEPDMDSGETSSSFSELRYLYHWIQKSLPFLVILGSKLVIQHALGLAVGVGLFMTFLYVNKSLQTQVFLQDRHSKLQCLWLLLFMTLSTSLLYYTFLPESLHYCLIFLVPSIEPLGFWEVLWTVGVTNFIIKFLMMGTKCLILLPPSSLLSFRSQGRWLMLTEELGQIYQALAPVPPWFRYLVTYQEVDGNTGLTLGVLLALVYLIMKLLGLYSQRTAITKTVRIFSKGEHTGMPASRSQCSEAGDVCPICQGEYRDPRSLVCQHVFCDECIALWFNREKSCPLCRTVITEKVYKWRDGATSPHLQIY